MMILLLHSNLSMLRHLPKSKPFPFVAWYRPSNDPVDSFNKLGNILSILTMKADKFFSTDTNFDLAKNSTDQPFDNDL